VLNLDGATHGINYTGKLRQEVIAGRIDDAASVVVDERRDHCPIGSKKLLKNPEQED